MKILTSTILSLFLFLNQQTSYAAAGDLDPSFDLDGKVITDFGQSEGARGVAVLSDDKIIVAGGGAAFSLVARFCAIIRTAAWIPPSLRASSPKTWPFFRSLTVTVTKSTRS